MNSIVKRYRSPRKHLTPQCSLHHLCGPQSCFYSADSNSRDVATKNEKALSKSSLWSVWWISFETCCSGDLFWLRFNSFSSDGYQISRFRSWDWSLVLIQEYWGDARGWAWRPLRVRPWCRRFAQVCAGSRRAGTVLSAMSSYWFLASSGGCCCSRYRIHWGCWWTTNWCCRKVEWHSLSGFSAFDPRSARCLRLIDFSGRVLMSFRRDLSAAFHLSF